MPSTEQPQATDRRDQFRTELRHIAEEIRPLTDAVDSLYILLQHVWQNREEIFEVVHGYSPEERDTIRCERCSESPDIAEAIIDGWKELRNEDGKFWGICPDCFSSVEDNQAAKEAREGIAYCCDNPKLEWSGDPDYPGVSCATCGFVVADNGGLIVRNEEELKEERKPKERQAELF